MDHFVIEREQLLAGQARQSFADFAIAAQPDGIAIDRDGRGFLPPAFIEIAEEFQDIGAHAILAGACQCAVGGDRGLFAIVGTPGTVGKQHPGGRIIGTQPQSLAGIGISLPEIAGLRGLHGPLQEVLGFCGVFHGTLAQGLAKGLRIGRAGKFHGFAGG